jgi:hypothetical protein
MPKKKAKSQNLFIYNILIIIFALIIAGFVYSFAKKTLSNGVKIPKPDLSNEQVYQTAVELYEANPISDITIEVLNGCGERGIAGITADFLRSESIDVIRSENADNFDYVKTLLIQNSDELENLKTVAEILDFKINDTERVIFADEIGSDVDLTLIIGSDYRTIKPLRLYIANL